jgi:hypothetical protein
VQAHPRPPAAARLEDSLPLLQRECGGWRLAVAALLAACAAAVLAALLRGQ